MLERYTPLVRRVAHALQRMKPAFLDADDVVQDGMAGLLRAIRSRKPEASEPQFAAYARTSIHGAIIDGYRDVGIVSRSEYARAKQTRAAVERGDAVTNKDRDSAAQTFATAWQTAVDIDDEAAVGGALNDPAPGPEQRASENQLLRLAIDVLQAMPVRDRSIFIACEFDGEKRAHIARRYRISPSRVTQIIQATRQRILQVIG